MKTIQAAEHEIIEAFEALDTIDEKYALLFQMGDELPSMDPALKTDKNRVKGCQSILWFHLYQESGRFHLEADSDSMVIKGISALLVKLINGRTAEEIQTINMDFIDKIQIWKLASDRNSGLMAMLEHIHSVARLSRGKTSRVDNSTQAKDNTLV
jgi:cysteine desulfuration protein SufE